MNVDHDRIRQEILTELETTRARFHSLLDGLSEQDFKRQSRNPGWTNGEILAHMTFGFMVVNALFPMARLWGRLPRGSSKWFAALLNASTGIFNWFNMLGAQGQGKVFTCQRIGRIFDSALSSLTKKMASLQDHEWQRGMYYPTRWDASFGEFMTLEMLFRYPVTHFNFHMQQIER